MAKMKRMIEYIVAKAHPMRGGNKSTFNVRDYDIEKVDGGFDLTQKKKSPKANPRSSFIPFHVIEHVEYKLLADDLEK